MKLNADGVCVMSVYEDDVKGKYVLDKYLKLQDEVQFTERGFAKTSCINAATVSGPDACNMRLSLCKPECFATLST